MNKTKKAVTGVIVTFVLVIIFIAVMANVQTYIKENDIEVNFKTPESKQTHENVEPSSTDKRVTGHYNCSYDSLSNDIHCGGILGSGGNRYHLDY